MAGQRINSLDLLKGIAMLFVALVHFQEEICPPHHFIKILSSIGARGPQLFFVISGYLAWNSYHKSNKMATPSMRFVKDKFFRIAPTYYMVLFIIFIVSLLYNGISYLNKGCFIDYSLHISFLNGFFPQYINSIMGGEWYITKLFLFFLLVPCLAKIIVNTKTALVSTTVSLFLSSVALVFFNKHFSSDIESDAFVEMFFHTYSLFIQLPVILFGVCVYYISKEERKVQKHYFLIISIITFLLTCCFIFFHLNKKILSSSTIAGMWFALLVLFMICRNATFNHPIVQPIIRIGTYSYGIYCIHESIIRVFAYYLHGSYNIAVWTILFLLIVVISFYIGRFIENNSHYLFSFKRKNL